MAKSKKKVAKKSDVKKSVAKKSKKSQIKKTIKKTVKTKSPVAKTKSAKKPVKKSLQKVVSAKPNKKIIPVQTSLSPKAPKKSLTHMITPLDDRLIVQAAETEKMTAGGIYIPDTATISGNKKGQVLVVGRGHMDKKGRIQPLDVKVGDWVIFSEHAGSSIKIQGENYLCLRESELLGITTK